MQTFDLFPLCAIINKQVFCVHAGFGPETTLEGIQNEDRNKEIGNEGLINDIVWADPEESIQDWTSMTGAGWMFGQNPFNHFMQSGGFTLLVRSHQLQMNGFGYCFDKRCLTITSSPNYTYRMNNMASILKLDDQLNQNLVLFNQK